MTRIVPPTAENIRMAAAAIRRGEPVGMPTETVYGLAVSCFDEEAVARVFSVKERPAFDPLIVHVAWPLEQQGPSPLSRLALLQIVHTARMGSGSRQKAEKLMAACWPGPLTLVLPKSPRVPDLVTSGLDTVAVRMPRHLVARQLIEWAGTPLAAPSANRFGHISPTSAQAVQEELHSRIDMILDGGSCEIGLESTVLWLADEGAPLLLRPGAIDIGQIESIIEQSVALASERPPSLSPGRLQAHYAPRKPLCLLAGEALSQGLEDLEGLAEKLPLPEYIGLLLFQGTPERVRRHWEKITSRHIIVRVLSESGCLTEAAKNFFALLRELDNSAAQCIFAEPCPRREGLGFAIQDRLDRASRCKPAGRTRGND